MHKTLRQILFWFFLLAFFAIGTFLILKAQGLMFDADTLSFVKTGGIFLRFAPSEADIFLDGERYEKTASLWNSGILINNLVPRSYAVRVELEGRHSWEKTFSVEPGLVASASNIRLFEEGPEMKPVSARIVEDFWVAKDGVVEKSWGKLYFGDTPLKGTDIFELSPERSELITTDANRNFFLISLSDPKTATNLRTLFASLAETRGELLRGIRVSSVTLHPFSPSSVIIRYGTAVFSMDVKKLELQKIIEEKGEGQLRTASNEAFWVTSSTVFAYNLVLGNLSSIPLSPKAEPGSWKTDKAGSLFLYRDGKGSLHLFDRRSASSTEIAVNVRNFTISKNEKLLLVIQNDDRALLHYLAEGTGDVKIPKGTTQSFPIPKRFSLSSAEIMWDTNIPEHLFFVKDGIFMGSEVDTRAPVNVYPLAENILKAEYRDRKFILLMGDGALIELNFEF